MTENQWLNAEEPYFPPRGEIEGTARKLRLTMLGFVTPLNQILHDQAQKLLPILFKWAEGGDRTELMPMRIDNNWPQRTATDLAVGVVEAILNYCQSVDAQDPYRGVFRPLDEIPHHAARAFVLNKVGATPADLSPNHPWHKAWQDAWYAARCAQADLVRCIFGNPFHPVPLDPRWLSSTVLDLAHIIYDEFGQIAPGLPGVTERHAASGSLSSDPRQAGGYSKMPILGDALMDAGCDSEAIIQHCHGPGPHVRGCWVVDLLLGKA